MNLLARNARQLVLIDAALLMGGVLMTSFNLLLVGWSVYAIGHVLAIVAFLAIAAYYRPKMDGWSWTGLLVLELGLVLALPQIATIWQAYYQTPTGALMQLPFQAAPIGHEAEIVLWIGLAFYSLAARGAKALPAGAAWIFVVAAVLGLVAALADVWFITAYWWVLAMFMVAFGLVATGGNLQTSDSRVESNATA
jgi:peptidoglycan/LPS O-acetylase OafA/YrhL